jgi:pimeloyl-ACP methyl ester carboxylesterase
MIKDFSLIKYLLIIKNTKSMKNLYLVLVILLVTNYVLAQNEDCGIQDTPNPEIPVIFENPLEPFIPPPPPPPPPVEGSGDKIVFFGHGYGGDDASWSSAEHISSAKIPHSNGNDINDMIGFPAKKINTRTPSFGSTETLEYYGNEVNKYAFKESYNLAQTLEQSKNNFFISHSMGGLVARRAALEGGDNSNVDGFRAGGIVTVATPNHGAQLANNILVLDPQQSTPLPSESIENFLSDALNSLKEGPESEGVYNSLLLRFLKKHTDVFDDLGLIENVIDELSGQILKLIPYLNITAIDLMKNDPSINILQNNPIPTTNVAYYGRESKDLTMWRLFFWGRNSPNTPPTGLLQDQEIIHFQAGDDKFAVQIFEENFAKYQMKYDDFLLKEKKHNSEISDYCGTLNPFNIGKCAKAVSDRNAAQEAKIGYGRGRQWWMKSTQYWDYLTGARETIQSGEYCICTDYSTMPEPTEFKSRNCEPSNPDIKCFGPITSPYEQYKDNDGVVLKESAVDFPGAVFIDELEKSNHFQMRNDNSTKGMLLELFGEDGDNSLEFFETEDL